MDLRITGLTKDPRVVSEALRVMPTRTWLVGDLVSPPATARRRTSNGWLLASGCPPGASLSDHFEALLVALSSLPKEPIELTSAADVEIRCAITDYAGQVPLIVPPDIARLASRLGARIYLSYYDLSRTGQVDA